MSLFGLWHEKSHSLFVDLIQMRMQCEKFKICNTVCRKSLTGDPDVVQLWRFLYNFSGECLQSLYKFLAQELWRSVSSWYLRRNFPFVILNLACWAFCKVSFWTCHYLRLGIVLEGLIKMLIRRIWVTYGCANFYSLCRHILLSVHFWIGLIVFYWTLTTFFPLWILLSITCKLYLLLLGGHHSNSFCKEF